MFSEKLGEQREAQRLQKRFLPRAEKYIAFAYACPPYDDDEFNELLDQFIPDEVARQRIRQMVSNARERIRWEWENH